MNLAVILAAVSAVIQAIAPLLDECAKKRLTKAAKKVGKPSSFPTERAYSDALHDEAIKNARLKPVKAALGKLKVAVVDGDKVRTRPLSAAEIREGQRVAKGLPLR